MKKIKIAIIISISLVVIGTIITVGALMSVGFDLANFNNLKPITHTHVLEGDVSNISAYLNESDIRIIPSKDDDLKVVSRETDKIYHEVNIEANTLSIHRIDERKWHELLFNYDNKMDLEIHVPKNTFDRLYIEQVSGSIDIPKEFYFEEAEIRTVNGDVNFFGTAKKSLTIENLGGFVNIQNFLPEQSNITAVHGELNLKNIDSDTI